MQDKPSRSYCLILFSWDLDHDLGRATNSSGEWPHFTQLESIDRLSYQSHGKRWSLVRHARRKWYVRFQILRRTQAAFGRNPSIPSCHRPDFSYQLAHTHSLFPWCLHWVLAKPESQISWMAFSARMVWVSRKWHLPSLKCSVIKTCCDVHYRLFHLECWVATSYQLWSRTRPSPKSQTFQFWQVEYPWLWTVRLLPLASN